MPKSNSAEKIQLASLESLFGPDVPASSGEQLPVDQLYHFPNHPFKLYDDTRMAEMVESVRTHGILMPILVRPREGGGYEIVAGHNRVEAAKRAGLSLIPATIREMDDDTAILLMVDSNLRQREQLLPSEKAFAYKMKLGALKRQAGRPSKNSPQVAANFRADDEVAKDAGISGDTIRRFVRLTLLITPFLERVDTGRMAFGPAVALSHLTDDQQNQLLSIMELEDCSPSLEQAEALKAASQEGTLDYEAMHKLLREQKPNQARVTIPRDRIQKFFTDQATPKQIEDCIVKALELYQKYQKNKEKQNDQPERA